MAKSHPSPDRHMLLLSSSFSKPWAHGSLQEKLVFYLPYLPVLRADFVVFKEVLENRS